MNESGEAGVLRHSRIAAGLMSIDAQRGRMFIAQRLRVDRLDELDAEAADSIAAQAVSDEYYDPVAEDIARAEAWERREETGDTGGFDESTYQLENIRQIRALHKATLPPTDDVFDTCRRGDLPKLCELVETFGHDINHLDRWDASPLYYACLCGHKDVVLYLLNHGARCASDESS